MLMTAAEAAHIAVAIKAHARELRREMIRNGYDPRGPHRAMIARLNAIADDLMPRPVPPPPADVPEPTPRELAARRERERAAERSRRYRARKRDTVTAP